jgi:hypothetical protein
MQRIPLTRDFYALVDDADFQELSAYQWQVLMPGGPEGRKYAVRYQRGKAIYMHRVLLKDQLTTERPHCDHRNGDGLDNRRENLRACTRTENQRNRRCQSRQGRTSQFKGVNKTRSGWTAKISIAPYTQQYIGCFKSETVAALAYDQAALTYHGEFANLNFPAQAV